MAIYYSAVLVVSTPGEQQSVLAPLGCLGDCCHGAMWTAEGGEERGLNFGNRRPTHPPTIFALKDLEKFRPSQSEFLNATAHNRLTPNMCFVRKYILRLNFHLPTFHTSEYSAGLKYPRSSSQPPLRVPASWLPLQTDLKTEIGTPSRKLCQQQCLANRSLVVDCKIDRPVSRAKELLEKRAPRHKLI